jgi:hypothetical protein
MNQPDRVPAYVHVRVHKPSLGPYTFDNPNICMNCGKWLNGVPINEPCNPEAVLATRAASAMADTAVKAHAWTEYPDGWAHCSACGAARRHDGVVLFGAPVLLGGASRRPCEPASTRRMIDGVIVDGPPS